MRNYSSSLIVVLLFTTLSTQAQKQTTFYILPHAGIEWVFSKFEDKVPIQSIIKKIAPEKTDKYGVALLIDFNRKSTIEIGYGHGNLGWNIVLNKNRHRHSSFGGASTNRTYLRFSRPIKMVEIFKRRHENLDKLLKLDKSFNYWAVFNISLIGGFSYGYIPANTTTSSLSINGGQLSSSIVNIKRSGFAIHGGLNFQFYKNHKKIIQIGIIYQKGLMKRVLVNWEVNGDGINEPEFQTFTRDSMLAIYVAYPIKLFAIKEKGTIKGS